MSSLPNTPPKGTSDWFPEEYKIRKYIFDTWRTVCLSYGFEEYLGPIVESIDIWKAKSWEDVGGSELTQITNRDGKFDGLAIRPEMTPTVTRMASRIWKETDKPLKWFSIANFYRNEKPQKGRNREFWQLNVDIFGEDNMNADIEILLLSLELMRAFTPPQGSYVLKINHRWLIYSFLTDILWVKGSQVQTNIIRLMDKYEKLSAENFKKSLYAIDPECEFELIEKFMQSKSIADLKKNFISLAGSDSFREFEYIFQTLSKLGYIHELEFSGSLIRGFDYYDGIIFEMFDTNKDNPRAIFWGGRYNGLASIFGVKEGISAVWFAPWDETMKIFLEWYWLLESIKNTFTPKYYFPLVSNAYFSDIQKIAHELRLSWKRVHLWLSEKKLQKALRYALKNNYSHIVIYAENEKENWQYIIKNLKTEEEKICKV